MLNKDTFNEKKLSVLQFLQDLNSPVSTVDIAAALDIGVSERTIRRWLVQWEEQGLVLRTGKKRGTKYVWLNTPADQSSTNKTNKEVARLSVRSNDAEYNAAPSTPKQQEPQTPHFAFLDAVPKHRREALLAQLRTLWTHSSTALEGNTLTLGDTHFLLEEGLTISGKPLREHNEVIGHARAIELMYRSIQQPLTREFIWELHKAVQTDMVTDIYKPNGSWKVEINGTTVLNEDGKTEYMEYAHPTHVDVLMGSVIAYTNSYDISTITLENAPAVYAKVHTAIAHIHPFWDGNGRIARLLANILLLKAGLPHS